MTTLVHSVPCVELLRASFSRIAGHITCTGIKCEKGMKLCCMIRNGNPYKSCVSAGQSCEKYWSSSCKRPCVLDCNRARDSCVCSCSERPSRTYG
uniref:Uncharacterized protein n=1 Tax=Rhipicephalus appendiculatus TaxID=34631 RepID=A0A131Z481_RHIAP